ncbi:hypothetical protein ABZ801_13810 [Actinomadura sp. NPDC047616]|uniref:hypothetical protein n=1 Tax=Actinomadura sp. NPDC047616 TaxID=3155914 RepID=UPI0033DC32E6
MNDVTGGKSFMPTRKWWAALITALTVVMINWVQAGSLSKEILIALIGVMSQAVVSYLVPNDSTPGGVPLKR